MILFTILLVLSIIGVITTLVYAFTAGISFIITFGDLIVFALIVLLIVKIINRKKK